MEPELGTLTAADVEHLTDWDAPPLDAVPHEVRPDIVAYHLAVAGIPDCFDSLEEGEDLVSAAGWSVTDGHAMPTTSGSVDRFVRAHLAMIDTWWLAIDSLDAAVRGPSGLPPWAQEFVKGELRSLFDATTALQRAVIAYHHGSAGPELSSAYGYQYALSNGTVAPFC
ncbi:hypothetical protein [Streptomyces murinus]|uniref:hypothetical protein n=1 Tax=Streptomyces murinus TaxID=33900 RepID=UPI0038219463